MDNGMEVRAGNKRRVQVRKAPRLCFTAERRQAFLDHLAACRDVMRSAAGGRVPPLHSVNFVNFRAAA